VEKLIYLTWSREGLGAEEYAEHLLEEVAPALLGAGARALNLGLTDVRETLADHPLVMGEGATLSAAVSLWLDCLDQRAPLEEALAAQARRMDGYLVTESVPQPFPGRDWPDGARCPGVTHFTWFPKPEGLSDEAFYHGWHEVHTPHSFELHPLRCEYVRNAVARAITPGAPTVHAIVAERFPRLEDYTNPGRLYGSKEALQRTIEDLPLYADMATMHATPLSEVIVKSLGV